MKPDHSALRNTYSAIINGPGTKADKARALFGAGVTQKARISELLGGYSVGAIANALAVKEPSTRPTTHPRQNRVGAANPSPISGEQAKTYVVSDPPENCDDWEAHRLASKGHWSSTVNGQEIHATDDLLSMALSEPKRTKITARNLLALGFGTEQIQARIRVSDQTVHGVLKAEWKFIQACHYLLSELPIALKKELVLALNLSNTEAFDVAFLVGHHAKIKYWELNQF